MQLNKFFRSNVELIIKSQFRRGPDFSAIEVVPGKQSVAVLGHNRLSIIDLSTKGNQPMWDIDRRVVIVYNGEIYNYLELRADLISLGHHFMSDSDTEVIIESFKRWGTAAFNRFNGMFAFALFDITNEKFYLVRDRFGVKPVYYVLRDDTLYFASTAGVIAKLLNLSPNLEYMSTGVRYGLYEHSDASPYSGMQALSPAHFLELSHDQSPTLIASWRQYYDLFARTEEQVDSLATMSIEQAAASLIDLLDNAVRIRLRSDVPVAVSLSGGLDSGSVASLAAVNPGQRLHGFTFGDQKELSSEGPVAAELARMADIDITYVWPSVNEICRVYRECIDAQVGPFPGGSIIAQYLVFKAARNAGFKVLLGGQGGDEAFMGYRKFQAFHLRKLAEQKQYLNVIGFGLTLLPTILAERWRWLDSWKTRSRYLNRAGIPTMLRLPSNELSIGYSPIEPLRIRQILDITLASLPTLLRYEDSNSMGNSIESRLPFLDYRVMEFGIALPSALKLRKGYGKWIVRKIMADRIPDSIRLARYKKGFDVQQNSWIDGGLGNCIRTMLHERYDMIRDYLAPSSNLDELFSNELLKSKPFAFAEATTLIWLGNASASIKSEI